MRISRQIAGRLVAPVAMSAILAVATSSAASGQTFPTDDPVIKRMWALGNG